MKVELVNRVIVCVISLSWVLIPSVHCITNKHTNYYQTEQSSVEYEPGDETFDSCDIYQSLYFKANWTKQKLFWKSRDFDFESRYLNEQTCVSRTHCQLPFVQIIVIPFSHNDPGWLKTFSNYYETKTKFILDNAVKKLTEHKNMTFVWSEISFLSKWWDEATQDKKTTLRNLLHEGRFEILTGGWVMPDEATPSLFGLTHQLIEGNQWLKRNLNYRPTAAWSIDPFGHNSVMPYLLKNSGIEGMMIQRLHYAWKHWLAERRNGNFYWTQRWDNTGKHDIPTLNSPYDIYPTKHFCGPMPEVCMKFNFRHIPGHDDEEHLAHMKPVTQSNIMELADQLMGQYRRTASLTKHNIVLTGVGDDFQFNEAIEWDQQYYNYQSLFNFINNNPQRYNANVQFGTLSQYFQLVKRSKVELPNFKGDFFPYSDVFFPYAPAYWTGYYGTRPFWKKLCRETEDELRKAEILYTYTLNYMKQHNSTLQMQVLSKKYNLLVQARRWVALFQHHDGITGTSPRSTMVDYAEKLFEAIKFSEHIQSICVKQLAERQLLTYQPYFNGIGDSFSNLADKVPLQLDLGSIKKVLLFNGLGWKKAHLVRVLVNTPHVMVYGPSGEHITSQINPKIGVTDKGETGILADMYELVFMAYLQGLAITTYEIRRAKESVNRYPATQIQNLAVRASVKCRNCGYNIDHLQPQEGITMENAQITATFGENGLLKRISQKSSVSAKVNLTYGKYNADLGSGAYLSRPYTNYPEDITCKNEAVSQIYVVSGPVLQEINVICKELQISSYILHQGYPETLSAVYLTNAVKPGKNNFGEFFMSFQTDLETTKQNNFNGQVEPTFYTDTNLAVEKRMKVSTLPFEGNLYPVTNYAFIQDAQSGRRLSVLVDRSHGFTSAKSGQLETIFDRRLAYDDARGMDEGVDDPEDMVSNYVIVLEPYSEVKAPEQDWLPSLHVQRASKFLNYQPSAFVYDVQETQLSPRISLFSKEFPADIFLLNLRSVPGSSRDVPSSKALMTIQNLGHKQIADITTTINITKVLGSDFKIAHHFVPTDLVGNKKSNEDASIIQSLAKIGFAPVGEPFELSSFLISF